MASLNVLRRHSHEPGEKPVPPGRRFVKSLKTWAERSLVIILFLAAWEFLPRWGIVDPVFVSPLSDVVGALANLASTGVLWKHLSISLERAIAGFLVAAILAIPLGFMVGGFKRVERFLDPMLQVIRQLPVLAMFPVIIIFFGIDEVSKVAIIATAGFQAMFLNVVLGVKSVDPLMVRSAKSLGFRGKDMFLKVILPASLPAVFSGLRYGATVSLILLVAAEMLGANAGLGYAINNWQVLFMIPEMYSGILVLCLMGLISNYLLVWIEKRVTHWKEEIAS